MKSLLLISKAALFFLLPLSFMAMAEGNAGGSIAIEDGIMLLTSVNSSHGTISEIEIFNSSGALIQTINGCGATQCTSNLSKLNTSTYDVEVTTSTGYAFSGSVFVNNM